MSLAKNIVRARKSAELSQTELARLIEKSRSSVSEYESGEHEPGLPVLRRIAKATKCELADLLA